MMLHRLPSTYANKRFGRYEPEEERVLRKNDIVRDATFERFEKGWQAFDYNPVIRATELANYSNALSVVKGIMPSPKDVEAFSISIEKFQNEQHFEKKAGLFLSALIHSGKGKDFIIHTKHIGEICNLGFANVKNVVVYGDAGEYLGCEAYDGTITVKGNVGDLIGFYLHGGSIIVEGNAGDGAGQEMDSGIILIEGDAGFEPGKHMKGGSILVKGNADIFVGAEMEGGSITVEGDAGERTGTFMQGGTIKINGNAGSCVGCFMQGGTIHLEGDYKSVGEELEGGEIYHKGKLIFKK